MAEVDDSRTEYGVNTTNKFAFLDDESVDPSELLNRPKEKKVKQPKVPKTAAPAPAPVKPETKENNENRRPPAQTRGPNDRRGPPRNVQQRGDKMAERFGEKPRDENRPPREFNNRPRREFVNREGGGNRPRGPPRSENRQAQNDAAFNQTDEQPVQQQEGEERQNKPPRTFQRDGPRQFRRDRMNGSEKAGVRSQVKKQGHGAANWGNTDDQLAGETDPLNQTADETQPKADGEVPAEGGEEKAPGVEDGEQNAEPKEEEAPKMTLEEWKAQHATAKVEFKTRQANEGADQQSLQKFVPLKREEEEKKTEDNKKKKGLRSNVLNIELSFNDPNRRDYGGPRRGGDRDVRPSGPRGPPMRGGPRQAYGQKLDMSTDFPALGAH